MLSTLIIILVSYALGAYLGLILSGSSKFSLAYKVPDEVSDNYPALPEDHRFRVARSITGLHRIYIQERKWHGWSNTDAWGAWRSSDGYGDMARVAKRNDDWWMTSGLSSSIGFLLESHPEYIVK